MSDRSEPIFKLQQDVRFRAAYIRSKLNLLIPSQLRGLRLKGKTTQKQLADEAEMKQPRISAMERPGEIKFSLETLIRMAAAHKVGLQVKFVPYSEMLHWENNYRQDEFEVVRLEEDEAFLDPVEAQAGDAQSIAETTVTSNTQAASAVEQDQPRAECARKPMSVVSMAQSEKEAVGAAAGA